MKNRRYTKRLSFPRLSSIVLFFVIFQILFVLTCRAEKIKALYFTLHGSINPAQVDLVRGAFFFAKTKGFDVIIMGLDTPGGLGESMRKIVKLILNSSLPVAVWVGPRGARAASAGVFIVAASNFATMAPQTSIGAASPVGMGGKDIPKTLEKKIKNDFMSLIRGVARSRGRNIQWYQRAIEDAVSLTAEEAVINRVVDSIAISPRDLMVQWGKKGIEEEGRFITFEKNEFVIETYTPPFRYRFLSWLLDPQIAYLLLLGGIVGLFFELAHPGVIFPGIFGGICLLLALYALSILPTNVTGLLLIFMAMILFLLEAKIVSYGLLTIGGLISLFLGSTILFRFKYGLSRLPIKTILPTVIVVGGLVSLVMYLAARVQLKPKTTGKEAMIGLEGEVIEGGKGRVRIRVRGEIWRAMEREGKELMPGERVEVLDIEGLNLIVKPINKKNKE